jgi:hypothetical protein
MKLEQLESDMQVVVFVILAGLISAAGLWLATRETSDSKKSPVNPPPTTAGAEPIRYISQAEDEGSD